MIITFSFDKITNIDLKNYRMLIVDINFEEGFEVFDFEKVFLMKKGSYLLKY